MDTGEAGQQQAGAAAGQPGPRERVERVRGRASSKQKAKKRKSLEKALAVADRTETKVGGRLPAPGDGWQPCLKGSANLKCAGGWAGVVEQAALSWRARAGGHKRGAAAAAALGTLPRAGACLFIAFLNVSSAS